MQTEIVFSGLCAFNNLSDKNPTMPEPSVILVRTDADAEVQARSVDPSSTDDKTSPLFSPAVAATISARWKRPRSVIDKKDSVEADAAPDVHIPHLSFNSTEVRVNEEAETLFRQVPLAPGFRFMQLNGVEVEIATDPPAKPNLDDSYDLVLKKDDYWPEAKNQWNRDFVPERGKQPKRSAVVGFMRFGSGTISAGHLAPVKWKFERNGQGPLVGKFAEEVVYSGFPHEGDEVVLRIRDIETRELIHELRFSPVVPGLEKLTLFIGNNDSNDIDNAVQRRVAIDSRDNRHFKFLNRISSAKDLGRIPTVVRDPLPQPPDNDRVGGLSTGPCGPITSNGK
jgi:hypothetical protein